MEWWWHFFFAVWTWNRCWPSKQKLWREIGIADFSQSMWMRVSLAFCTFSHLFTFFTLFSFFHLFFFFFFAFFFAHSLTWPRPQPCRLTVPSLTLRHITSPLLSFLNTIFKNIGASRFSADFCVKKFLPTKKADHFKVYPYVQLSTLDTNCHSKCIMSVRWWCGQSTLLNRSIFFWNKCRSPTLMSEAVN